MVVNNELLLTRELIKIEKWQHVYMVFRQVGRTGGHEKRNDLSGSSY